ncbi:ion channel [Streptomyces meridianus]|uniref:Ion channel n=1 Tax=Streptomyces meridianus TaxID=2938945 RepID=A0ABT0X1U0_9ACTN|nr:ion channel [Streptomyces meridianus]MCM2575868.1 ion channel [Streptomyces meridianus]
MPLVGESFVARWEKRTLPWMTGLALLSLVVYVSSAATESPPLLWSVIDYGIWALFAADFVLRFSLAENRWTFLKRNPLDVLALLVPSMRVLRALTIIGRLSVVARRGRSERLLASTGIVVAMAILALAAAVLQAERNAAGSTITSLPDALWWAMTTTTTVGYGDLAPVTAAGRLYGSVLMIIGIGTMGTVTAALASRLVVPPRAGAVPDAAEPAVLPRQADGQAVSGAREALDGLHRLGELHAAGVLTESEFTAKKRELLSRI